MEINIITGRNPVTEALKSGHPIEKLIVARGSEKTTAKIIAMAKDRGVPVYYAERQRLEAVCQGSAHQGVAAYVSSYEYVQIEDILERARKREEDPFVVILDGIEDPHNLGAIIRNADGAGAHGVIIPKRRSAGITETVAKVSAGAVEYMAVARVSNLVQAIETLKEKGLWIAAADMDEEPYYEKDLKGKIGLVIGNEGSGISKLVKAHCDFSVSIPMKGGVASLNASSAAAVLLYEIRKQRDRGKK